MTSAAPTSSDGPSDSCRNTAPMTSETSGTKKMYDAARPASPEDTSPNQSDHERAVPTRAA